MFQSTETNLKVTFDCQKNNVNIQLLTSSRIVPILKLQVNYYLCVQLGNVKSYPCLMHMFDRLWYPYFLIRRNPSLVTSNLLSLKLNNINNNNDNNNSSLKSLTEIIDEYLSLMTQ